MILPEYVNNADIVNNEKGRMKQIRAGHPRSMLGWPAEGAFPALRFSILEG
jgi:hypothetical protein